MSGIAARAGVQGCESGMARRFGKKLIVLSGLAALVIAAAAAAGVLCPYDPYAQDLSLAL